MSSSFVCFCGFLSCTFTSYLILSLFILFRLLLFGSSFCRLETFGSNLLCNLIFVGGIGLVNFQGLIFGIFCTCGLSGGAGSLLYEVQ